MPTNWRKQKPSSESATGRSGLPSPAAIESPSPPISRSRTSIETRAVAVVPLSRMISTVASVDRARRDLTCVSHRSWRGHRTEPSPSSKCQLHRLTFSPSSRTPTAVLGGLGDSFRARRRGYTTRRSRPPDRCTTAAPCCAPSRGLRFARQDLPRPGQNALPAHRIRVKNEVLFPRGTGGSGFLPPT